MNNYLRITAKCLSLASLALIGMFAFGGDEPWNFQSAREVTRLPPVSRGDIRRNDPGVVERQDWGGLVRCQPGIVLLMARSRNGASADRPLFPVVRLPGDLVF